MESTLREYKSPRKRFCRQHWATLTTRTILRPAIVPNFPTEVFCKQPPVFVNSRRFTECFDRYFHISTDRNETRTWSSFPPRSLRIKFGANPSTIC